jgi:phosphonate metabolism protein PhnN/1,5-bisphosphokinase (PRPP-forming)
LHGTLFLIVGPSGAGKDTLMAAARAALDARFVFPRRVITRPADPDGEDHEVTDERSFAASERAGAFALSWRAHGLAYGIPASIVEQIATGRNVVANVSRTVVATARARFPRTHVVLVTAAPEVLRARLAARGRESGDAIDERLGRVQEVAADSVIVNDGAPETAVRALLTVLKG